MIVPILLLAAAPQSGAGELLIDRNRVDRIKPAELPLDPKTPVHSSEIADGADGVTISGVRFVGRQAPAEVAAAAKAFLGQKATKQTLNRLAAALANAYASSPVALYTIAIPEQDFRAGVVLVSLTEGHIAHAQVATDKASAFRQLRKRMAPLTAERPLSRRTFERQLTLMRSLPGLTVETSFADPIGTGALTLTATPKQRRHKFTGSFTTRGVQTLGDGQFDLTGIFYGAATDGDQLTLAGSAASDFKRYRYLSGGYSAPLHASGLTASLNAAYLQTRPRGLPLKGEARLATATLSYPLVRSFHQALDLSLGVDGLNSDNALFGNVVSRERTRAIRASAGFVDARTRRTFSASASVSKGFDGFGARVDPRLADAGFAKVTLSSNVTHAIGRRASGRLSLSGQYSRDRLPAAERYAIGGEAIGRAFDNGFLTGDRGAGALAELAYRPFKGKRIKQTELYAFVDGGIVSIAGRAGTARQSFELASAGFGARAKYDTKAELGLEVARSVRDPVASYDRDWRLFLSWRISR